jgi:hypothetical protein
VAAILTNVPIKDLLEVLVKLSSKYDLVDILIDPEEKKILIDPVDRVEDDSELNDDNIYTLV